VKRRAKVMLDLCLGLLECWADTAEAVCGALPRTTGRYRPASGVPDDGNTSFQNVPLPDNRLGTHQGVKMPSGYDIMTKYPPRWGRKTGNRV
jgi:hypothetical protein